ncbi:MAG: glycerol kinase, partial [Oscillospiraceae bacterium]|nr:glycerol kinase [Oscillospiraceae bacterium]
PDTTEATALGAAYLAGLAVGVWKNADELKSRRRTEQRFTPGMESRRREALLRGWNRAVERSLAWKEM